MPGGGGLVVRSPLTVVVTANSVLPRGVARSNCAVSGAVGGG
jgi:hypothetical protein